MYQHICIILGYPAAANRFADQSLFCRLWDKLGEVRGIDYTILATPEPQSFEGQCPASVELQEGPLPPAQLPTILDWLWGLHKSLDGKVAPELSRYLVVNPLYPLLEPGRIQAVLSALGAQARLAHTSLLGPAYAGDGLAYQEKVELQLGRLIVPAALAVDATALGQPPACACAVSIALTEAISAATPEGERAAYAISIF